jgi:hypothetical protein
LFPGTIFHFLYIYLTYFDLIFCFFLDALFSQCAKFIRHFDPALHITSYDISRALKRINFTKKKLSRINIKRNSVQRESWWTSPAPQGVFSFLSFSGIKIKTISREAEERVN